MKAGIAGWAWTLGCTGKGLKAPEAIREQEGTVEPHLKTDWLDEHPFLIQRIYKECMFFVWQWYRCCLRSYISAWIGLY